MLSLPVPHLLPATFHLTHYLTDTAMAGNVIQVSIYCVPWPSYILHLNLVLENFT